MRFDSKTCKHYLVNGQNCLSPNALTYEDEVGIELNDQANFIRTLKTLKVTCRTTIPKNKNGSSMH